MKHEKIKLDHSTMQEKVTSQLRKAILFKEYKPGMRLVQEELADAFGVSRMPIREALRRLEIEGLVEMLPHRGAFVTSISLEDIEEIYELRALLEGMAVRKSLTTLTQADIEKLEDLVEQMANNVMKKNIDLFVEHNNEFHRLLRKGSNGKRINRIIDQLWNGYPPYAPNLVPQTIDQSNREHEMMVEAVKERNQEKLAALMRAHILRTGMALKERFQ